MTGSELFNYTLTHDTHNEDTECQHEPDGYLTVGTFCLHCPASIITVSGPADDIDTEWSN